MDKPEITAKTGLYGLIGNPIAHSLSPVIYNYLFEKYSIDDIYLAFNINEPQLADTVEGFKALGVKGINVTAPYKEKIIKHLDELSQEAELIGAVNTVINNDGNLCGFNTDYYGIIKSLESENITLEGKRALLLGSGGAAKAVCFALNSLGLSETVILNRTKDNAKKLSDKLKEKRIFSQYEELNAVNIKKEVKNADIIVNATSVDVLSYYTEEVDLKGLKSKETVFFDLTYNKDKTLFLKEAQKNGYKTIDGLSMLVYQALAAFGIWRKVSISEEECKNLFTLLK